MIGKLTLLRRRHLLTSARIHPRPTLRKEVQTSADPTGPAGPQVWDAMTVEVALSLMTAARTRHLDICDEDGRRTGRVTLSGLTAVRDSPHYTDRIRLREVAGALAGSH